MDEQKKANEGDNPTKPVKRVGNLKDHDFKDGKPVRKASKE